MTKSYKHNKYCVAGLTTKNGKWIRLVSSKGHENAISKFVVDNPPRKECLDIIYVNLLEKTPLGCQKENFLIDENEEIIKGGSVSINDLLNEKFLSNTPFIFRNFSKCISEEEANRLGHSLVFVLVKNLTFRNSFNDTFGKWSNKCSFEYNGYRYIDISLTDPEYRSEIYNGKTLENAAIVVSLPSEPYEKDGMFYKFVAKVFEL